MITTHSSQALVTPPLHIDQATLRLLLERLGPSLALWRAAEIAALREQQYEPPIVDLGCGDGLVTSLVLSNVDLGIDPDPQALERAKERKIYARLEACEAQDLSLPRNSVGTIISNSVLEHIPRVESVLAWAGRVLRPGGRLVFTVPSERFSDWLFFSSPEYVARRKRELTHLNLWPVEVWGGMLAAAGLRMVHRCHYLSREQVRFWDALDVAQQPRIAGRGCFSIVWRSLPGFLLDHLAGQGSVKNFATPGPGGGLLIVAQKRPV